MMMIMTRRPPHHHPTLIRHYVAEFDLGGLAVTGEPPRVTVVSDPFKVRQHQAALWTTAQRAEEILRVVAQGIASAPQIVSATELEQFIALTAHSLSIPVTPQADLIARVERALDSIEGQFRQMRDNGGFSQAHRKWRADRIAGADVPRTYSAFAMRLRQRLISELARKMLAAKN